MSLQDLLNKATTQTNRTTPSRGGLSSLLERARQGIPVQEPLKSVDEKGRMIFRVGEGLTQQQTQRAKEVISKPVIPVGQEIKTPFFQSGVLAPSGGGIGAGYSALKTLIEFPEKATRTLTTDFGKPRQTEEKQWRVPSYSETASKEIGQLIDEGVTPTAAIILGSAKVSGEFANDALIFDFVLGSAVRKIAKTVVSTNEARTVAYDFLGRPKTLSEAETNFRSIQKEFHPDISGTDIISKQANNAITILRKNGIPYQNILQKGLDTLFNRPLSSFFKPKTTPATPKLLSNEKIIETVEGWTTPGLKAKFDRALGDKDAKTIKELLPDVPIKYQQAFSKEISALTGQTIPPAPILSLAERVGVPKPPPPKPLEAPVTPKTALGREIAPKAEIIPKDLEPQIVKVPGEQLPVKTEGETQISRLEARQKELLDKITPEQAKEAGLSTFEQMNKKEQISKATEYVQKNPEEALRVVEGKLPPPKDLLQNSIALALETHAEMAGNTNLIAKLASLRSTRFGQEISILTEADPLNVVSVARDIQVARETSTIKKLGKKISQVKKEADEVVSKVIKEERTLAQIKVAEAEKLLNEIMC